MAFTQLNGGYLFADIHFKFWSRFKQFHIDIYLHVQISYCNFLSQWPCFTKLLCDHSHTDHTYPGCPEPDGLVILLLYFEGCVVCSRATNLHYYE